MATRPGGLSAPRASAPDDRLAIAADVIPAVREYAIRSLTAANHVATAVARPDGVVADECAHAVAARAALQEVVAAASKEPIVTAIAVQAIRATASLEAVVPVATAE